MAANKENAAIMTDANDESLKKVMSPKEYVSDSLGMSSMNVINIMTSQLTYFYTNMVGMAPGLAGTALMIPRIFDAISDIIMGRVFDKSNNPEGKVKPWFRRMLILLPLSIILLFLVPKASPMIQGGYAVLTNIFACAVCFTIAYIPYLALMNYRTKNAEEKGKMGVYRQIASYAVGYGITITLMPVTTALGGNQRAWIIYALFFTILSFVCLFICYKGIKERYVEDGVSAEEEQKISTMQSIGILLKNSYWVKLTIICLLITVVYAMVNSAPVYYFQYVFGNANLWSVYNIIGLAASVAAFLVTPFMIQHFGMVNTVRCSYIISSIGLLLRGLLPTNLIAVYASNAILMIGLAASTAVVPVLVMNSAEYNKYKHNVALYGMTASANSFSTKVAGGVGAAVIGFILQIGRFDGTLEVQPESAIKAIYALNIWIPLVMFIISFLIIMTIDLDKKYSFYVAENQKRESAQ